MEFTPLTADQRLAFDRDGYLVIKGALPPEMVERKMRMLKTIDRKVADLQIKNDILKEVRCIEARVMARKYAKDKAARDNEVLSN